MLNILTAIFTLTCSLMSNSQTTTTALSMSTSSTSTPLSTFPSSPSSFTSNKGAFLRDKVIQASTQFEQNNPVDVHGVSWLEHINLVVSSNVHAKYFYLDFLGFTPDASKSFHVNLGQNQFHLAQSKDGDTQQVQKIYGSIGLTLPSLDTLRERIPDAETYFSSLQEEEAQKEGKTQFKILSNEKDCVSVRGPDGNIFHLYSMTDDLVCDNEASSSPQKMVRMHKNKSGVYGSHRMAVRGQPGIRFIEMYCKPGTAQKIGEFYKEILGCEVLFYDNNNDDEDDGESTAIVNLGSNHLIFSELKKKQDKDDDSDSDDGGWKKEEEDKMKGVHICIYVFNFQDLYKRLDEMNLIWTNPRFTHLDSCDTWEEAKASRTLRFKDVICLSNNNNKNEKLLELEHEVRPLRHGQYLKVQRYDPK